MKYKFEKVIPIYTGGGVYCYYGKTKDSYFICGDEYWVSFVDYIPFEDRHIVCEEMWYNEWLDSHTIKELLTDDEVNEFCEQMLKWVIKEHKKNGYIEDGNYDVDDIEYHLDRIRDN